MHSDLVHATENNDGVWDEYNGNVYSNIDYTNVYNEAEDENEDAETVQNSSENIDINHENDESKDDVILESVPDSEYHLRKASNTRTIWGRSRLQPEITANLKGVNKVLTYMYSEDILRTSTQ